MPKAKPKPKPRGRPKKETYKIQPRVNLDSYARIHAWKDNCGSLGGVIDALVAFSYHENRRWEAFVKTVNQKGLDDATREDFFKTLRENGYEN